MSERTTKASGKTDKSNLKKISIILNIEVKQDGKNQRFCYGCNIPPLLDVILLRGSEFDCVY